jgi:hypothetical protein
VSRDVTRITDVKLVASGGATLPSVRPLEALSMSVDSALTVIDGVRPSQRKHTAEAIRDALARTEGLDLPDLMRRFEAAMRPATVDELNVLCARLCAGYPTKSRDPLFSVILAEEVGAMQPSVAVLETTVRRLLRTEKFFPTIAEVLEAIAEAEWDLDNKRRELAKAPERIAEARETLRLLERTPEERERDERDRAREARELAIEKCVELLMGGCEPAESYDSGVTKRPVRLVLSSEKWGGRSGSGEFTVGMIREARRRALAALGKKPGWDERAYERMFGGVDELLRIAAGGLPRGSPIV